jgi:hypothetical protein
MNLSVGCEVFGDDITYEETRKCDLSMNNGLIGK